ncbi:uncharacterized protein V1510DRAFT_415437 [Dipodascopsis tothii]|uniref:uncharacterized protein n=1 Tax=Dipodascopsis tothii TaxID=44089 RepID=UPI0034D01201
MSLFRSLVRPYGTPSVAWSRLAAGVRASARARVARGNATAAQVPRRSIGQAYKDFHDRRPNTTQILQSLVIGAVGDGVSQVWLSDTDFDLFRSGTAMFSLALLSVPAYHWLKVQAKYLNLPNKYASVLLKAVCHQLFFAPFYLSSFVSIGTLAQGVTDPGELVARVWQRAPNAWRNGWMFWPNVVMINFTLVPPHLRGLVAAGASVIWQVYLSWLTFSAPMAAVTEGPAHLAETVKTSLHLAEDSA